MPESRASTLLLRNVPLFASLSEEQREAVARRLQRRNYPRGATIIKAGDQTGSLHIILSGRAQVVISDKKGRRVILALLRSGDYFGEMGLLDDRPRSANVVAREASEILTLDKGDFASCLKENFELAMTVARGLAQRLRAADMRIGSLALLDVYGRVAQVLLQEAEIVDGLRVISGRLSKQDIARMIGASRERVSRVMTDLARRGLIETRGSSIVLTDGDGSLD
jgi:CRP/FNR family transcriptional regulator, cyclic AMP receptor protein